MQCSGVSRGGIAREADAGRWHFSRVLVLR